MGGRRTIQDERPAAAPAEPVPAGAEGTPDRSRAAGPGRARPRTKRRRNWAAGVSAAAALLSATAGMITAGAGVWRPPVPIPVARVSISWVGPTAPPGAVASTPTAAPAPAPSPTPTPAPSTYQSNWASGMDGWTGVPEWKTIPGLLVSDGSAHASEGAASRAGDSVQPSRQPSTTNYAVEARVQIVDPTQGGCYVDILLRSQTDGQGPDRHGYTLGWAQGRGAFVGRFFPGYNHTTVKEARFSPGGDWHVYRAEVEQNQLTLKIDGSTVLQATDNNYLEAGQVGLGNSNCQVQVSSFGFAPL